MEDNECNCPRIVRLCLPTIELSTRPLGDPAIQFGSIAPRAVLKQQQALCRRSAFSLHCNQSVPDAFAADGSPVVLRGMSQSPCLMPNAETIARARSEPLKFVSSIKRVHAARFHPTITG